MKIIVKKLGALLIAMAMLFTAVPVVYAGVEYSVEDAYAECAELYPEFVEKVTAEGVSDSQIIDLLKTVQSYLIGLDEEITEDNFEAYVMEAVNYAITLRKHIAVRNALVAAFPDAVVDGVDGVINEKFIPLVTTIKNIIFSNGMLDEDTSGEKEENPTTDAPTDEPTDKPTDVPTDKPTEKPTDEPTDKPTDAPTEKPTEKPTTSKPVTGGPGIGGPVSGDKVDEEPIEIPTEQPTEKPTEIDKKPAFSDMNSAAWAEEAVNALVGMGIISGYPDGTFLPNKSITRAEFAKIIVLASGRYDKDAKCSFGDVKETDWFYSYVASAYELGFITGRSDTVFDPNSNITRADLCLIVYRYIKSINSEFKASTTANFADGDKIPAWTTEAVNALYSAGIVGGMGDNRFDPLAPATRAQSAKIVHGAIKAALGI